MKEEKRLLRPSEIRKLSIHLSGLHSIIEDMSPHQIELLASVALKIIKGDSINK